jgi:hypothetical protein
MSLAAMGTSEQRNDPAARLALVRSPELRRAILHPEIGPIDKRGHRLSVRRLLKAQMYQGKSRSSFLDAAASVLPIGATASNIRD